MNARYSRASASCAPAVLPAGRSAKDDPIARAIGVAAQLPELRCRCRDGSRRCGAPGSAAGSSRQLRYERRERLDVAVHVGDGRGHAARRTGPDDGVPHAAVREVDAYQPAQRHVEVRRQPPARSSASAARTSRRCAARTGAWSRAASPPRPRARCRRRAGRPASCVCSYAAGGEDLAHGRARRRHRQRVAEERAAGRHRRLLVVAARGTLHDLGHVLRSSRRRPAGRPPRSTCRS